MGSDEKIFGTGRGFGEKTSIARFSKKRLIPMAVIIEHSLGAFRSGR
jgi:methyl coenzyme M reductase subunit C-like uncharacterized protein (methanogenesis marker protein 7)